ncbi:unnamed protein product [Arabidopsis lyrata]|nr:unnamed protein product [Arabidopsis lyrata]
MCRSQNKTAEVKEKSQELEHEINLWKDQNVWRTTSSFLCIILLPVSGDSDFKANVAKS